MSLPDIPGPRSRGRKGAGQVGMQLQEAGAWQAGGPSKQNWQVCPGRQGLSHLGVQGRVCLLFPLGALGSCSLSRHLLSVQISGLLGPTDPQIES